MDFYTGIGQGRQDGFVPATVLLGDELFGAAGDPLELGEWLQAVGRRVLRQHIAEGLLAQAGDADHEELVQVRGEDREKLYPLEQRVIGVLGFFKHARVELQPAQFAVDEVLGKKLGAGGAHWLSLPRSGRGQGEAKIRRFCEDLSV